MASVAYAYVPILAFLLVAIMFPIGTFLATRYIRPSAYSPAKATTYECGELPLGDAMIQFHFQYYIWAIVFVVFDLLVVFFFLFATMFGAFIEAANWFPIIMLVTASVIMLGILVYALKMEEFIWI